jgi:uncharacterized RDD family membrane protein YckC
MKLMKKLLFLVSLLGAYLIDTLLFIFILYLLRHMGTAAYVLVLALKFGYRVLTTGFWGSTIGMRILGLKLNHYSLRLCLTRELYRIGSSMFFLGYFTAVVDPYGRTLHDLAAGTMVVYGAERELASPKTRLAFKLIAAVMVVISASWWGIKFFIDDLGLIGLRKAAVSGEYYQSFEGDNLVSLSQNELYLKSIGRKYTTPIEFDDGLHLVRISNKKTYVELYRMDIEGKEVTGSYIGSTKFPLQFICSGVFRSKLEMVGLSPSNTIYFLDNKGECFAQRELSIDNAVTLSCGDLDRDGRDEAAVMGQSGDMEILKYKNGELQSLYSGKIGEDILPETFYIPGDFVVSGGENKNRVLYTYAYENGSLIYKNKATLNTDSSGRIARFGDAAIISYIYRNNMTFNVGRVQRLEVYIIEGKAHRLYNFGNRKGRRYDYRVRSLENVVDVDGDNRDEVILKAMEKDQVEGERYRIEIYKLSPFWLGINRILTFLENIM